MLTHWFDLDRALAEMDVMNRQMDALWGTLGGRQPARANGRVSTSPRAHLRDEGDRFVLTADLPGIGADDVDLHVTEDGVTLDAHRNLEAPEGATARRAERGAWRVRESFAFPVKVEPENVVAEFDHGVLMVTLPKIARQQPRRVAITTV